MEIYFERTNEIKVFDLNGKKRLLKDILKELNISLDSVILIKNDKITLEDVEVEDKDKIKLLSVVSGG